MARTPGMAKTDRGSAIRPSAGVLHWQVGLAFQTKTGRWVDPEPLKRIVVSAH